MASVMRSEGLAMRIGALALVAVLHLAAPAGAQPAAPAAASFREADALVAAIGYQVIPRSLVVAYQRAFMPAQPAAMALQALIDDRLLAAEARRYALGPRHKELDEERRRFPLPEGFAATEWDQILLDRVMSRRFLAFRFGDFVPVSREDVRAFIQANPAGFKGSAEANEAKARALLLPMVRSKREEAFKAELRERVHVRVVREALPPD